MDAAEINFVNDVFDVDIISAIKNIESNLRQTNITKTKSGLSTEEYIQRLWDSVSAYCEYKCLPFDDDVKIGKLIVNSDENFYLFAISIDLMQRPLHKLNSFLNYHLANFYGNEYAAKDQFVVMIENLAEKIAEKSPVYDQQRLDRIENWVQIAKNSSSQDDRQIF